jgi:hypothetical protein
VSAEQNDHLYHTVEPWDSVRRRVGRFDSVDPVKAVTVSPKLRRSASRKAAPRSKRRRLFSLAEYPSLPFGIYGPRSTMICTQPWHGTRNGRANGDPFWTQDLVYLSVFSMVLRKAYSP